MDIPVGKPEDQERAERAIAAFKKNAAQGPKPKSRAEISNRAASLLAEIQENLSKDLVYFTEQDRIIDSPEHAMALMLAGKKLEVRPRPQDKPLVVKKGPIIEGEKP